MSRRLTAAVVFATALLLALIPAVAGAQSQDWPRESPPGPLAARKVSFPPYQLKTLSNGLQVLVVLHHEQPSVSFRLLVRAGAMQEPADRPGVASFVASLLNQGTTTRTAEQIARAIDSAGGGLGTAAAPEHALVNGARLQDPAEAHLSMPPGKR